MTQTWNKVLERSYKDEIRTKLEHENSSIVTLDQLVKTTLFYNIPHVFVAILYPS